MEIIWYQLWLADQLHFYHMEFLACLASMEATGKKHTEVLGNSWVLSRQVCLYIPTLIYRGKKTT